MARRAIRQRCSRSAKLAASPWFAAESSGPIGPNKVRVALARAVPNDFEAGNGRADRALVPRLSAAPSGGDVGEHKRSNKLPSGDKHTHTEVLFRFRNGRD